MYGVDVAMCVLSFVAVGLGGFCVVVEDVVEAIARCDVTVMVAGADGVVAGVCGGMTVCKKPPNIAKIPRAA